MTNLENLTTKNFTALNISSRLRKGNETVEIVKFRKNGTKSVFFTPIVNGKRLTRQLFGRRNSAEHLATKFLNR